MTRMSDGVRYQVVARGNGQPLLLLHGFTGRGTSWGSVLPDLAYRGRIITVDLLGHGGSDNPEPYRHAIERQAADIAIIVQRQGDGPADVIGYSFGARVALRLAIDFPDSVGRLIVESPSAGIAGANERAARRKADRYWVEMLERGELGRFVREWEGQRMFESQRRLPATVRGHVTEERLGNRPHGLANSLLGAGQGVMTPLQDRLGAITMPTLVISGALDPRGSENATEVAHGIPRVLHGSIPEAGHTPHLETPHRFVHMVNEFLTASAAPSITTLAT